VLKIPTVDDWYCLIPAVLAFDSAGTSTGVILCGLVMIRGDFDAESSDDYTRRSQ
jgi:hypothetical protein